MAFRLQPEPPVPLDPHRTFDRFLVDASNLAAFGVSQAIAIQIRDCRSPLVICGRTGVGKTHLAQALVHEVRGRHPDVDAVYLTVDALVEEITGAVRGNGIAALRRRLARADVLVVDDAHQLAGRAEEELVDLIDAVHAARHQMVLTTVAPPRDLRGVRPELRQRLEHGSIVTIEAPSIETRAAVALRQAAALGADMPAGVALLVAAECPATVDAVESAVMRLCIAAELQGSALTPELAREVLALPPEERPEPVRPAPRVRPRRAGRRAAANSPGDFAAGVDELREFIRDVGGGRIGEPVVGDHQVDVPLVARDGERYVLRIAVGAYLSEPPSCTFVDEAGRWSVDAWPVSGEGGPFRSPEFICTPPTAEFYAYHPYRVYHYGEGTLATAVAAVFQALQAPEYGGRRSRGRGRRRWGRWAGG